MRLLRMRVRTIRLVTIIVCKNVCQIQYTPATHWNVRDIQINLWREGD